jgi:hypothetical protein
MCGSHDRAPVPRRNEWPGVVMHANGNNYFGGRRIMAPGPPEQKQEPLSKNKLKAK